MGGTVAMKLTASVPTLPSSSITLLPTWVAYRLPLMTTTASLLALSAPVAKVRSVIWKPPVPAACTGEAPLSATALATTAAMDSRNCSAPSVNGVLFCLAVSVSSRALSSTPTVTTLSASIAALKRPSTSAQVALAASPATPGCTV